MKAKKFNHLGHLLCLAFGVKACQVLTIRAHYKHGLVVEAIALRKPTKLAANRRAIQRRRICFTVNLHNRKVVQRLKEALS